MILPLFDATLVIAGASLIGVMVIAFATLRAWQGWLELKREELGRRGLPMARDEGSGFGSARIEMADIKERIRKLEAIASGVEL
jgi:hypothetical protein